MTELSPQQYICRLSNKVRRRLDNIPKHYDALTGAEGRVLNYLLIKRGDTFQRDVEAEFDFRSSTATEILKSMESKGLIRREPVAEDARLKKIIITPNGLVYEKQVQANLVAIDEQILCGISDEERETFFRVAQVMLKNLSD